MERTREDVTSKLLALPGRVVSEPGVERALSIINARFALRELSPEEVRLGRMALCNDAYDRTHERFAPEFLAKLGETLVGKAVLAHHSKREFPLGRFYEARIEPAADGTRWLMADYYALKTAENEALRAEIDAGVVSYVSVGFRGGREFCDTCGDWWQPWSRECGHWPGEPVTRRSGDGATGRPEIVTLTWKDPDGTAEAVEGSYVWLGAQYEAQVVKAREGRARCAVRGARWGGKRAGGGGVVAVAACAPRTAHRARD